MSGGADRSYIVSLAREMRDGDRVFVGANQNDVALAGCLARRLWAPRLKLWFSGGARLDAARDLENIGRWTLDDVLVERRDAFFWQARAFDEMGIRGPVCFAGGLQVDGRGNANLEGIRAGDAGWRLRGPGSAGLPSLTAWPSRFYIGVPNHDRKVLVTECARLSVIGDPVRRAEVGLEPYALRAVITPMATFEPTSEGLVLSAIREGLDVDDVAGRTGFALEVAETLAIRPAPTPEEVSALEVLEAAADRNNERRP